MPVQVLFNHHIVNVRSQDERNEPDEHLTLHVFAAVYPQAAEVARIQAGLSPTTPTVPAGNGESTGLPPDLIPKTKTDSPAPTPKSRGRLEVEPGGRFPSVIPDKSASPRQNAIDRGQDLFSFYNPQIPYSFLEDDPLPTFDGARYIPYWDRRR
jgi:hypothetical protein